MSLATKKKETIFLRGELKVLYFVPFIVLDKNLFTQRIIVKDCEFVSLIKV